jgi:hypothetical protein
MRLMKTALQVALLVAALAAIVRATDREMPEPAVIQPAVAKLAN